MERKPMVGSGQSGLTSDHPPLGAVQPLPACACNARVAKSTNLGTLFLGEEDHMYCAEFPPLSTYACELH